MSQGMQRGSDKRGCGGFARGKGLCSLRDYGIACQRAVGPCCMRALGDRLLYLAAGLLPIGLNTRGPLGSVYTTNVGLQMSP